MKVLWADMKTRLAHLLLFQEENLLCSGLLTHLWFRALLIGELGIVCMRLQKRQKINFIYSLAILKGTSF